MDDYRLAQLLLDQHTEEGADGTSEAPRIMYVPGRGWYYWSEDRWTLDDTGMMTRLAAAAIYSAPQTADGRTLEASAKRIHALLSLTQDLPGATVPASALDANAYFLNTPSGYVDLRTSMHAPPSPTDRLTKQTTAPYDPTAEAPRFLQFLSEVIPDPATRSFLQRAVGYSATGSPAEEVLFFLVGKGANGKTTFLSTIRQVLGDYANTVPTSLLTSRFQASHDSDRLSLLGLRFAVANETDFGQSIAEAKVKSLVSTEAITARGAYEKKAATFQPSHHLWLSTNYLPNIDGSDDGLARRLLVIDFPATFQRQDRDPLLSAALQAESSGILNWIVEGARLYFQEGLNPPEVLNEAVTEYRQDMDVFSTFIHENLEEGPPATHRATNPEVWEAFSRWQASEPHNNRLGRREFGSAMKRHYKQSNQGGVRLWPGVRVRYPGDTGAETAEQAALRGGSYAP